MNGDANSDAPVARYHPALVALHWLVALVIAAPLVFGARHLASMENTDPMKVSGLQVHIGVGLLVGCLMLVRVMLRLRTRRPAPATSGSALLARLAWASHRLLYLAVLGQVATGLLIAWQAGLFEIVFGGNRVLPADFWVFPARPLHYVLSRLVMALIALHVLGAVYHTFVLRDGLLRRMWFARAARGSTPHRASPRPEVS